VLKKKKEMEEKQEQRVKFMEEANQKKRMESEIKKHEKEEKLKQARLRN